MEQRQLEFFLAVADELHFGRAAKKLHVTEQPLSYQIKKLESELGLLLFERTTRSVSLTPAGHVFAEDARDLLSRAERAVDSARRVAEGSSGVIRLGYESSTAPAILSAFVKCFRVEYPHIGLVLAECSTRGLAHLAEDEIDACLITRYVRLPRGIDYTPIVEDVAVVALTKNHPYAQRDSVGIEELSGVPLLGYTGRDSEPANQFMARLAAQFDLEFMQMAETPMALLSLVAAGMGFTASTGTMSEFIAGEVSYLRIANPQIPLDHGLALPATGQAPTVQALKSVASLVSKSLDSEFKV